MPGLNFGAYRASVDVDFVYTDGLEERFARRLSGCRCDVGAFSLSKPSGCETDRCCAAANKEVIGLFEAEGGKEAAPGCLDEFRECTKLCKYSGQ